MRVRNPASTSSVTVRPSNAALALTRRYSASSISKVVLMDAEKQISASPSTFEDYVIDGVPLHFAEEMRAVLLTVVGELLSAVMKPYVN